MPPVSAPDVMRIGVGQEVENRQWPSDVEVWFVVVFESPELRLSHRSALFQSPMLPGHKSSVLQILPAARCLYLRSSVPAAGRPMQSEQKPRWLLPSSWPTIRWMLERLRYDEMRSGGKQQLACSASASSIRTSHDSFFITLSFRRKENFRKNSATLFPTRDEQTPYAYNNTRRAAASLNNAVNPRGG